MDAPNGLTSSDIKQILTHLVGDACEEAGYGFWCNADTSPLECAFKIPFCRPLGFYVRHHPGVKGNGGDIILETFDDFGRRGLPRRQKRLLLANPLVKEHIIKALLELRGVGESSGNV